jgi:hypothetical protein
MNLLGDSYIEVGTEEYLESDSEELEAYLGTCCGIGAYDSKTGTVYLLHIPTLENDSLREQVQQFIDEIEDSLTPPYEVLAGGTMDSRYNPLTDEDFAENARRTVEEVLSQLDVNPTIEWNSEPVFNRLIASPNHGLLYDIAEE